MRVQAACIRLGGFGGADMEDHSIVFATMKSGICSRCSAGIPAGAFARAAAWVCLGFWCFPFFAGCSSRMPAPRGAAFGPREARPARTGGGDLGLAGGPAVALPAGSPSGSSSPCGAILVAGSGFAGAREAFVSQLQAAVRLGPDFLVCLGDVSVDPSGQWRIEGREVGGLRSPAGLPVYTFAEASPAGAGHRRVVPADGISLFFMRRDALRDSGDETLRWLSTQLRPASPCQHVLLLWDGPPWSGATRRGWEMVEGVLFGLRCNVHVVSAGVDRFSWWRQDNVRYFCVGPSRTGTPSAGSPADGRVNGLVWLSLAWDRLEFRVVMPESLFPPQVFDRQLQLERAALARALSASAIDPVACTTTVRCRNPTSRELGFETVWCFDEISAAPEVDPQVLGFTLKPGQDFVQEFRFRDVKGIPLKFLCPEFHASTAGVDGLGRPVPITVRVRPVVRMRGTILQLGPTARVDGVPDEWPGTGYPLNHHSQVVHGRAGWRGPGDLSGSVRVGTDEHNLYVALEVRGERSRWAEEGHYSTGTIYLDRQTAGQDRLRDTGSTVLAVEGDSAGAVRVRGVAENAVDAASGGIGEAGFVLEARVPYTTFTGGRPAECVWLDAVVSEGDSEGDKVTLCFSGTLDGLRSGRYFAAFTFEDADEADQQP